MKTLIISFIITIIPLLGISQSQILNKDIEIIEDFHSVNVNSRYTVYLKQSNETKIKVKALKEVLEISEFKVENGVLNIDIKREEENKSIWEQIDDIKIAPTLDVYISMKDVNALRVNGNGRIITENSISSNNLNIMLSGSGTLDADIKAENALINHSGSGLINLKGYANHATINLSGYGKIQAYELDLKTSESKITGSGDIEINVSDKLEAFVYGSGSMKFKGNTQNVTKKEYGTGKIERTY